MIHKYKNCQKIGNFYFGQTLEEIYKKCDDMNVVLLVYNDDIRIVIHFDSYLTISVEVGKIYLHKKSTYKQYHSSFPYYCFEDGTHANRIFNKIFPDIEFHLNSKSLFKNERDRLLFFDFVDRN